MNKSVGTRAGMYVPKETLMIMQNPLVSALPALLTSFWVPTAVTANRTRWRRHYGKFPLRYGNYKVTRGNERDRVHEQFWSRPMDMRRVSIMDYVGCSLCIRIRSLQSVLCCMIVCIYKSCTEVMLRESSAPPALVYICICATNPGTANANKLCIG